MSEMVERVARALNRSKRNSPPDYPEGWLERHVNENWHLFEDDARTAIKELREPTEEMLGVVYGNHGETNGSDSAARETWQAMIDAALR